MRHRALLAAALILALSPSPGSQSPSRDVGAPAVWQRLLKLRNPASVLHVTAHPDDEHGGVLTKLSRGDGARMALVALNRGESGDNAIGPQLFDALGLIRTEELVQAGRYYGIDEQYFTTMVDYGYSKRLEEAFDKWERDAALRDVVRVIRMSRPWVVLSRFQGNARDGHGHHAAAGVVAVEAARAAGDPARFSDQIAEGLRPWQPHKVYIGGVRESEDWTVRLDSGEYSPWLGESFDNIARLGLSFQRSQNGGRFVPSSGPNHGYYKRVDAAWAKTPALRENTMFDGLAATHEALLGAGARPIDEAIARAMASFSITHPEASAPALAEGLTATRTLLAARVADAEAVFALRVKEAQFQSAINAALAMELSAVTEPAVMGAPVPGQTFDVRVRAASRGGSRMAGTALGFARAGEVPALQLIGAPGWSVTAKGEGLYSVTLASDAALSTKPYFSRAGLRESRYALSDASQFGRAASAPPLVAVARYTVDGAEVELREVVTRRESKLPYGEVLREVRSVPRLALTLSPSTAIAPLPGAGRPVEVDVALLHNGPDLTQGQVTLRLPSGWASEPAARRFSFARAGERATYRFSVRPGAIGAERYTIEGVASAGGREYREGYELIDHRDLEVRYLYRASSAEVRGVNVTTVPGLKVGYVMGIGDQVPQGLRQLGATVTLLGERELAGADLSTFDAIMTGTRAYAVREDVKTYNQRLLDYVKAGGNMVVLYNTQEFVPNTFAPLPGELPRSAEEVSEEDSPVEILAPAHQLLTWPNRITAADFDGWVEQRGSKFFTTWDAAYTPMIATHDIGQAPQRGGWLTAQVGKGHWTYLAYALHRQLPYGVPGAYRIAANLLALGKQP